MYNPSRSVSSSQDTASSQETGRGYANPNSAHLTHSVNPLRGLLSQESIGSAGWGAAGCVGDDGMISLLEEQGVPGTYDFLRQTDHHPTPSPSSSQVTNAYLEGYASQPQIPTLLSGGIPSTFPPAHQTPSSQPAHEYEHISPAQLNMVLDRSNPVSPNPYPTPLSTGFSGPPSANSFNFDSRSNAEAQQRSTSAASHHTTTNSISGSEYSCSATDVSEGEDAEMGYAEVTDGVGELGFGRMGLKGEKTWTQYDQDAVGAKGASGAARTRGAGGPLRRTSGGGAPNQEIDKLEHRRSINRKSAQKHRARRKEEAEESAIKIAERDAKIAQLERDLAVERARVTQLEEFVHALREGQGAASRRGSREQSENDAGSSREEEAEGKPERRRTRGVKRESMRKDGAGGGDGKGAGR